MNQTNHLWGESQHKLLFKAKIHTKRQRYKTVHFNDGKNYEVLWMTWLNYKTMEKFKVVDYKYRNIYCKIGTYSYTNIEVFWECIENDSTASTSDLTECLFLKVYNLSLKKN